MVDMVSFCPCMFLNAFFASWKALNDVWGDSWHLQDKVRRVITAVGVIALLVSHHFIMLVSRFPMHRSPFVRCPFTTLSAIKFNSAVHISTPLANCYPIKPFILEGIFPLHIKWTLISLKGKTSYPSTTFIPKRKLKFNVLSMGTNARVFLTLHIVPITINNELTTTLNVQCFHYPGLYGCETLSFTWGAKHNFKDAE